MQRDRIGRLASALSIRLGVPAHRDILIETLLEGIPKQSESHKTRFPVMLVLDHEFFERLRTDYDENLVIEPIPKNSFTRDQIAQYIREFYELQGFRYNKNASNLINWATLWFSGTSGLVKVALTYTSHHENGNQLFVTTKLI